MIKKKFSKKLKAFTLLEIVVACLIISFLVAMAVPSFMGSISKARSTEAQLQLESVYTLEKTYFFEHAKYSNDIKEIGYEPSKLTTQGGNANYQIEIMEASTTAFKAHATSIADFDADGVFNVWEVDQDKHVKEVTPD